MGNVVKKAVVAVGKFVAKSATTAAGNLIPVVGPALASHINSLYAAGGSVGKLAGASAPIPEGYKPQVINTPEQLIAMVKKAPDVAAKAGLTVEKIQEAVAAAKDGQAVAAKRRGGKAKKGLKGEDSVMVRAGHEPAHFARGGRVLSVF